MIDRYRQMLLIRRFEEKAGQLFGMGMIDGFCHLAIGQEATIAGVHAALTPHDSKIAGYRAHGHMLCAGLEPQRIMAEFCGRATGYSGGHGGSIHLFDAQRNFYGGHGILGSQAPLATGLALAHKTRADQGLCACFIGDAAADQGQVFESFILAARLELPVLFVIENNSGTASGLHARGTALGLANAVVDGMDVEAVAASAAAAASHVRGGQPYLLEAITERFRGHSMAAPDKYKAGSKDTTQRQDPLTQVKEHLLSRGLASDDELRDMDKSVRQICNDAANFALDSPEPELQPWLGQVAG